MQSKLTRIKLLIAALGAGCFNAHAAIINFESLPLFTSVSSQFQADGVLFSSPGNPTQPIINTFSGTSTTGNILADFSFAGGYQVDANFTSPMSTVSAIAYANPNYKVTLSGFDANNMLLGSVISLGGSFNQGILTLTGIGPISKVSWTTGSPIAAVGIDNLYFSTVPEPSTYVAGLLLALPVVVQGVRRFKKRQ